MASAKGLVGTCEAEESGPPESLLSSPLHARGSVPSRLELVDAIVTLHVTHEGAKCEIFASPRCDVSPSSYAARGVDTPAPPEHVREVMLEPPNPQGSIACDVHIVWQDKQGGNVSVIFTMLNLEPSSHHTLTPHMSFDPSSVTAPAVLPQLSMTKINASHKNLSRLPGLTALSSVAPFSTPFKNRRGMPKCTCQLPPIFTGKSESHAVVHRWPCARARSDAGPFSHSVWSDRELFKRKEAERCTRWRDKQEARLQHLLERIKRREEDELLLQEQNFGHSTRSPSRSPRPLLSGSLSSRDSHARTPRPPLNPKGQRTQSDRQSPRTLRLEHSSCQSSNTGTSRCGSGHGVAWSDEKAVAASHIQVIPLLRQ